MADGFSGMGALIRSLQQLPEHLKTEAAAIVDTTVSLMATELRNAYPKGTGNLRRGVIVQKDGPLRSKVKSKAPHAHLYEYGTVRRHTNRRGANRGVMPAKPTLVPLAQRRRRVMQTQLVRLVQSARVEGMTGTLEVRER